MKYDQTIISFRASYLKLNYNKSNMLIGDLYEWVAAWCQENNIPKELYKSFCSLATAYVEKEWYEEFLDRQCNKKR